MMNKFEANKPREFKVLCAERPEVAEAALRDLAESFRFLGISGWKLPSVTVRFIKSEDQNNPEKGRTGTITDQGAEIVFDERFAAPESQREFEHDLLMRGLDYPGFRQTLKHEMAHLSLWSVTGLDRQAAVRLVNEGWASLVEQIGTESAPDLESLVSKTRLELKRMKDEDPEIYERCMDLEHPVSQLKDEELNEGEYVVGRALLLWVMEKFGKDRMIELLRKTPTTSRLNSNALIPTATDPAIHAGHDKYRKIVNALESGAATIAETEEKAFLWEAAQFRTALLEVTGLSSIEEVEEELEAWIAFINKK